jgi:hypothetical protein
MRCRRAEYLQDGNMSLNKAWRSKFETSGVAKAETSDALIPKTLFPKICLVCNEQLRLERHHGKRLETATASGALSLTESLQCG